VTSSLTNSATYDAAPGGEARLTSVQLAELSFLLAACSLIYELAIAKTLSHLTGNAIVWESISIGVYIAGLGLGVWIFSRNERPHPVRLLTTIELLLSAIGGLSVILILLWHIAYRMYLYDHGRLLGADVIRPVVWFGAFAQFMTIVIGVLSGFELPLLFRISAQNGNKSRYGTLFGFHYFGALAGTLLFGLFFMRYSSAGAAAITAAAVNLLICIYLLRLQRLNHRRSLPRIAFAATPAIVCILVAVVSQSFVHQIQIKNFYYNNMRWTSDDGEEVAVQGPVKFSGLLQFLDDYKDVERIQTHMQSIDILEVPPTPQNTAMNRPSRPASFSVALDGAFQFNSATEAEYHEHITHIPTMLFRRPPSRALILGGGDGLVARELLRYGENISGITLVEIDPGMIAFAREDARMQALNLKSLDHEKVEVIVDDAFAWLRSTQKMYDTIYIDFPYPFNFDALRLYSVEFLRLVRARLLPEGYIVMDVPLDIDGVEFAAFNDIVFNTVRAAGFQTIVAFQSENETFITAATGLPVIYPDYLEFGVKPKTFGPNWFMKRGTNLVEIRNRVVSDKVNSIVKPRWLTEGNPRF